MEYKKLRVIISGGGTGGHIFPAISIANALKEANPDTELLFVGAEGKMEMEKVPAAGYKIVGLPIVGLQRKLNLRNIINDLKVLLQEQNGFAGLTNKLLGGKADCICVAYEGMERFFPKDKIVMTGNPIRKDIVPADVQMVHDGIEFYRLNPGMDHILILGGSLGSGTLNNAMKAWIEAGCPGGDCVEVLWQCGKYYKAGVDAFMAEMKAKGADLSRIHHTDFIGRMDLAYAVADVVITRSGASTVSELCAAGKAAIFVPSPNVAEDHQTHNAMALVRKDAALIVKDADAVKDLMRTALDLVANDAKIQELEKNISELALTDAGKTIVDCIYKVLDK